MIHSPTPYVVAATVIFLLLYDVEINTRKGGRATISWLALTLWLAHPFMMSSAWVLIGHLFWPLCGAMGMQSISPRAGAILAAGAIVVILWEVWARIRSHAEASVQIKTPTLTAGYAVRLAILALLSLTAGHVIFGQHVACAP